MGTPRRLWLLARPRLLPYVLCLVLVGFGWAHWDRALPGRGGWDLLWVLAAWILLHSGTLWLNAAVDRDEGEVLLGVAVEPPDGIEAWGYGALAACVILAAIADPLAGLCALICTLLSVLYSHPAVFLKAHPLGGPLVNGVGYGLLSPMAGWSVVDVSPNPRTVTCWTLGALGVLGAYFAAQAFQAEEDRDRGYRTLVATHGPQTVIRAARICISLGFVGGVGLAVLGWLPRACLLASPLFFWVDRWFARWARQPGGGTEAWAREMARRMLIAGLLGMGLAFGQYGWESYQGVPVGGVGTAAGRPTDRPWLPPSTMRLYEQTCDQSPRNERCQAWLERSHRSTR